MDAVVHLAFNHDISNFAQNAQDEIEAIEALGSALALGKLLVVTNGIGANPNAPGQARKESDPPTDSARMPRRPEQAAHSVASTGVHVAIARQKGVSAYVGDGANRWAAAPLIDVAHMYRLAVEKSGPGVTTYHAVQEEGDSLRDIAATIGKGLGVPLVSLPSEKAEEQFGPFFGHAVSQDMPASSEWTRKTLAWSPTGPGLIDDLSNMSY
jgi:hypothetical protein